MRWPGVKSAEYWLGQIWAKLVGGQASGKDGDGPIASVVVSQSNWSVLLNNFVLDDDPVQISSTPMTITGWSALWVHIHIVSTLAPTNIRVIAQFSDGSALGWWRFEEGLWASLMWEDTDTAAGVDKAFLLPCGGQDTVRFFVVATGTDAGNRFNITVRARAFRGHFGLAHA